eukprot:CAMPEP_0195058908 /NCGR_PEP_ID=MMETSP0448-20130528/6544_1 /TAXON_ID=66468 /ORGANISM="Heterocapsa triquestra, Strain CCMP 448" /LENGTH=306 /DNA_ID=CAMNT_0040089093 /DNA_START=37 /DNA_END=957 /DNA_ORIENTATION=-
MCPSTPTVTSQAARELGFNLTPEVFSTKDSHTQSLLGVSRCVSSWRRYRTPSPHRVHDALQEAGEQLEAAASDAESPCDVPRSTSSWRRCRTHSPERMHEALMGKGLKDLQARPVSASMALVPCSRAVTTGAVPVVAPPATLGAAVPVQQQPSCGCLPQGVPGKKKRSRRGKYTDYLVATQLKKLDDVDTNRVVTVRRIHRLGFTAKELVHEHFSRFGPLEDVLLSNADEEKTAEEVAQCRLRPFGYCFILFARAEDAQAALAAGSTQKIGLHDVFVATFVRHRTDVLGSEGSNSSHDTLPEHLSD